MLPTNVNRLAWQTFSEDISTVDSDSKMTVSGLLDQMSVTRDASDYLWYTTSVVINPSELHRGSAPSLSVESEGHALHVYVNNQLIGSAFGGPESRKVQFIGNANLRAGINKISLLSVTIGTKGVSTASTKLVLPRNSPKGVSTASTKLVLQRNSTKGVSTASTKLVLSRKLNTAS
ncbi:beta-galactosidase 3-like protein [Tanacetum coccineum]